MYRSIICINGIISHERTISNFILFLVFNFVSVETVSLIISRYLLNLRITIRFIQQQKYNNVILDDYNKLWHIIARIYSCIFYFIHFF